MASLEDTQRRRRERSRRHDIVLFGATGYTGQLVAAYLQERSDGADLRWAIAGRDRDKLERVRARLGLAAEVIVADSHDVASLEAMASQTGVVCSTVGPYARYGSELVAACVRHGTDYCDLTGEPQWIRRMIDEHQHAAERSGARIVHCCGFDSIPSDLGCLMMHEHFRALGGGLRAVTNYVGPLKGAFSGGTIASMLNIVEEARRDPGVRQVLRDPYSLNPPDVRSGPDGMGIAGVRHDGGWTAPFMMAAINARVVRRSNALMGFPYAREFRYDELLRFPDSLAGFLMATSYTAVLGAFAAASSIGPARALLQRHVLPAPGEGPSAGARERGHFRMVLEARGVTSEGAATARGILAAQGDPGYAVTAKFLGESALCLAVNGAILDSPGGIRTPASAMGKRLIERLRTHAGITFRVE